MPKLVFARKENVFAACEQLLIDGKFPTKDLVRERIGGGSYATIHKYLKEWFEIKQLSDFENASMGVDIPQSTHKLMIEWYKTIYIEIQKQVVNEQVNYLQNKVERLENENMGYEETKGELTAVKAMLKEYMDKTDNYVKRITQLELQLDIAKEREDKLKK